MRGRLTARSSLDSETRDAMLELMARHFEGADAASFARDLERKNWVVLIEDADGRLTGFSTLLFYTTEHEGEPLSVVYSGDTVMDRAGWHSSVMSRTWIDSVRRLHRAEGRGRLLWLLLTSGFRTYRFLPVYWREFYPRHDRKRPDSIRVLIDRLAGELFGERYDSATGVVRFDRCHVLRGGLLEVPASKVEDLHVRYFLGRNPGYRRGDELVCLTELSDANLTAAGRRMVRAGRERRGPGAILT